MNKSQFFSQVKEKISNGFIDEAIKELMLNVKDIEQSIQNTLITISASYFQSKKEFVTGKIKIDDFYQMQAKWITNILETISDIQNNYDLQPKEKIETIGLKNILFIASNPYDTARIKIDIESREIGKIFFDSDKIKFNNFFGVTPSLLQKLINKLKPHILHISAHTDGKNIMFNDEDNADYAKQVSIRDFVRLIEVFQLEIDCVVINANIDLLEANFLARSRFIKNLVFSNKALRDRDAIEFSKSFYMALNSDRDYEFAVALGNSSLALMGSDIESPYMFIKKNS